MKKKEFNFLSADGKTTIGATMWLPEGEPRAIVQIVHGMQEYVDRYDDFASFLCEQGIAAAGNDHLGHGRSVVSDDRHGYFADKNGNACLLKDIHHLRKGMQKHYPEVPYVVMGHSMGSFLTRQYIQEHGTGLAGAIIMGTGSQPGAVITAAKAVCRALAMVHGWDSPSDLVDKMAFGSYNEKFDPAEGSTAWLTKEQAIRKKYEADPWCTFRFTLNGYYNMFYSIGCAQDESAIRNVPADLPILVISGADDPVGGFGKGVRTAYEQLLSCGVKNVKLILKEGDRHEVLNETDQDEVYGQILEWLEGCL